MIHMICLLSAQYITCLFGDILDSSSSSYHGNQL